MNRIFFLLLAILPIIASAQSVNIQTKKGTVDFTYDEDTKGTLGEVSATVNFDLSDLSKGSISGSVNVSTIDTKSKLRNKHLKGKSYFDVENYPIMTFESSSITEKNGVFTILGKLTIKSTTKEVSFKGASKDGKLLLAAFIYGLDFDVAVDKKREKSGIEVFVTIPM